jgi:hypothetical protein
VHDARDLTYHCNLGALLIERAQARNQVEPEGVISGGSADYLVGVVI